MALTPSKTGDKRSAEDDVIIREIDEAVRQDDATEFIRRYGIAIAAVLIIALAGLGGYLFYDAQTESRLEAQSEQLMGVVDARDAENWDAVEERAAALIDADVPGVRTSARFMQASALLENGEPGGAVELYARIAADEEAPPAMRDLARIREVATDFDDRQPEEVIARLKDLAVPGNPFFGSAGELTAIAHLEAGNRKAAGSLFAAIAKDEDQPATLRDRARQMAGLLGVDAVEDVEALLEEQGISPDGEADERALAPGAVPAQQAPAGN